MDLLAALAALAAFLVVMIMGCGVPKLNISSPSRCVGYKVPKKIALLPISFKDIEVAALINRINYEVTAPARDQGYIIISNDEVKKFLGREYDELINNPVNITLTRKLANRFKVEALLYCRIDEWVYREPNGKPYYREIPISLPISFFEVNATVSFIQTPSAKCGPIYLSRISLTYALIDASTVKTLSTISGNIEDKTINMEYFHLLARKLAARLIGSL